MLLLNAFYMKDLWKCPQCGLRNNYDMEIADEDFCLLGKLLCDANLPEKYYEWLRQGVWYMIVIKGKNVNLGIFKQIFEEEL